MQHSLQLDQIRRQIAELFRNLGARTDNPICETILIRDGFYCGRRFEQDGFSATWFIAECELKVRSRSRAVLEVLKPIGAIANAADAA